MKNALAGLGLVLVVSLLAGCVSAGGAKYSGWMDDYSRLRPFKAPSGEPGMRWAGQKMGDGFYTAIIIDPVTYYPAPPADSQVSDRVLGEITGYLEDALQRQIGKNTMLWGKPGKGVLRMKVAITGVATPVEGLQPYEVIPIGAVFAGANAAAGERDHTTIVYLEAMLLDSQTNEVLARTVRQGTGKNLNNEQSQMTLESVRPVLDGWAADAAEFTRASIHHPAGQP